MNFLFFISIFFIIFGAFLDGTSCWPLKVVKKFGYEHYLFIYTFVGLFLIPWIMMFYLCDVNKFLCILGWKTILISNLISLLWGIANVLCIVCLTKIGFVMVGVLLGGTALIVSTLTPLIFKGSGVFSNAPDLFSQQGYISVFCVILMIVAIYLISKAGELRDKQLNSKGIEGERLNQFQSNMYKFLTVLAGFLSTGIFMINTYCANDIVNAMKQAGCYSNLNTISVWAVGMIGGVLLSVFYSLYIMNKNKSFSNFIDIKDTFVSFIGSCQFLVYICFFSYFTPILGPLGATIGNGVVSCVQIGSQQLIGFMFGEWKGVKGKPIKLFTIGIILLVIGIIILSLI